jgi:transketolase
VTKNEKVELLQEKVIWVKEETLKIHKIAPGTRLASSLSDIEIFVALYYGGILKFRADDVFWEDRDRFIISKGHGAVSMYPILADLGFFERVKLQEVGKEGSTLGVIPDTMTPGFETINGSLGNGLGVACGVALALKNKGCGAKVFVLVGDGELYEGAVWEAIMFASHHQLDNLILIVDKNKMSMLDYTKNVINLDPLNKKFEAFNWKVNTIDGHDMEEVHSKLMDLKIDLGAMPKVLIANTIKGKGIPQLENDTLCHVKSFNPDEIDQILEAMKCNQK